jgi:ribosomal protein L11 methyltransferase
MDWLEVSVVVDGEAAEAVAELLRPYAYQESVVLEQLGDMDDLDPNALEPVVTVKIYLPEQDDTPALRRRLEEILYHMGRLYPMPPPAFRTLAETDWANAWKVHYQPFRIGRRIWIQPSWIEDEAVVDAETGARVQPDDVVLMLDPGMAFGTGLHPTTQSCLRALEQLVQPGMRVLDVGTGSGILGIAAARLGARRAAGVDTDSVAVQAAVANAAHNGVADVFDIWQGALESVTERGWDVVVVNILAPVIVELLRTGDLLGYVAPTGRLVLSGIIDVQAPEVETAVMQAGGAVVERLVVRDWVTLVVRLRP